MIVIYWKYRKSLLIKAGFHCKVKRNKSAAGITWYPVTMLIFVVTHVFFLLLCWCFTALWHFSGHFGRGQLNYPHCSWASLLGTLPLLCAHYVTSNWQLPFLNKPKGENSRRNYFMTNLHKRMLPYVRIEPATIRIPDSIPDRRASDRATVPGTLFLAWSAI